jgi:hypothetical protein
MIALISFETKVIAIKISLINHCHNDVTGVTKKLPDISEN